MSRKFALVIGNTEYNDPELKQSITPSKDIEDFARVLQDPDICAFDNVITLLNQPAHFLREAIDIFCSQNKNDDLLILYFSGYGLRDETGALYLAAIDTTLSHLHSTAIKADYIREAMDQSHTNRQVLILDYVNSGTLAQGIESSTNERASIASVFKGTRIVLTASTSTQFAWEGDQIIGESSNSLFTHYLVKGLEGEADNDSDGHITVDELYDYAYDKVRLATPKQTPSKYSSKQQGEIILRKNIRVENIKPVSIPNQLVSEIESAYPELRLRAVNQLAKLLNGKNLGLARSAREALEKISTEDDSRHVSQMAMQALDSIHRTEQMTRKEITVKKEPEQLVSEKAWAERAAKEEAEKLSRTKAEREAKEKIDKSESKESKNLKISVTNPKLLSKRFASSFLLQIYLPEERSQVTRNIKSEFADQKTSEYMQLSTIRIGQRLKVKFFSPIIDFPDPVLKLIDRPVNKVILLGIPKDNCEPGAHKISVSILDADKGQELESFTTTVQVVDFAFDHISRPLLSRVSAIVLGISSFTMFILTFLAQIDKTIGLTSGTAAGVFALGIYASFYNLYQRVRPNTL